MTIFAIDPGPTSSGAVWYDAANRRVVTSYGELPNEVTLSSVRDADFDLLGCESIEAMYAHVGKETIRTIRFTGRIEEAGHVAGKPACLLTTQEVKKLVCGTAAAKDPAVRQALIDRIGAPGTKADKGPTYGVVKHAWRALAVAYAVSLLTNPEQ